MTRPLSLVGLYRHVRRLLRHTLCLRPGEGPHTVRVKNGTDLCIPAFPGEVIHNGVNNDPMIFRISAAQ